MLLCHHMPRLDSPEQKKGQAVAHLTTRMALLWISAAMPYTKHPTCPMPHGVAKGMLIAPSRPTLLRISSPPSALTFPFTDLPTWTGAHF